MNIHCKEEHNINLLKTLANREVLEDKAVAALTSETLQRLGINLEGLPRQSRILLEQVSIKLNDAELIELDPIAISLHKSKQMVENSRDQYEILKLKQENYKMQSKIDSNDQFLAKHRRDLETSKQELLSQNPNPDTIQEFIRQFKQKLTTYEEKYELAKNKYARLNVPEAILPKSIQAEIAALEALRQEAIKYKALADDAIFHKETKAMLSKLRKQ